MINTIFSSLLAAIIASVIGITLAFILVRTNTPFRNKLGFISITPFLIVPFLLGMTWDMLANKEIGILNQISRFLGFGTIFNIESILGLVWVLTLFTTPLVFLIISSSLRSQDTILEEIAAICGSNKKNTLFRITLAHINPAILSAFFLSFIVSAGAFGIHAVIGRGANIPLLTTEIYRSTNIIPVDFGMGAVLASILLAITLAWFYFHRRIIEKRDYSYITKNTRPLNAYRQRYYVKRIFK
ncbi:iron ABC transporter permease [Candidatus Poribacteria bacterium]|nr:iron ABC transporter permease [Candidatus Poribacteria bacterium]